jgi:hypothetical protein
MSHLPADYAILAPRYTYFSKGNEIQAIMRLSDFENVYSKEPFIDVAHSCPKTKYMLLSRYQNAGQNHDIKLANSTFEMWHTSNIWER